MGKFKETKDRITKEICVITDANCLAKQIIFDQLFNRDSYVDDDYGEPEFTQEQEDRIDEIYNACYDFCKVLTEKEDLEWSMYSIGEIVDTACRMILIDPSLGIDKIRFPSYVTTDDGEEVEEYMTSDDFEYGEF